jgi:hypothetical protein
VAARWIEADPGMIADMRWPYGGVPRLRDRAGRLVVLFRSLRDLDYCVERNPGVELKRLA